MFNSIYTQTEQTNERSKSQTIDRQTFFTSSLEMFTGITRSKRLNVGLLMQIKANTYGGAGALEALSFKNNTTDARSGVTTIAPAIKFQPIQSISNFSVQTAFYIPVFKDTPNAPYLDMRSYILETKMFYDKTFSSNKWQFFGEADVAYNFGEKSDDANPLTENISERFANNSFRVPLSAFLSYFPSQKSTVFVNAQQSFLIASGNNFAQNYTLLGLGGKYQLTDVLNLETSFGKIVRGNNYQGLGQTFSLGIRALF